MDTKKPSSHNLRMASRIVVTDRLRLDPVAIKVGAQKIATLGDKICSEKVNYLVLHSLSNLDRAIPKMLEHKQVFLALDLDFPGKIKTKALLELDSKFIDLSSKYNKNECKDINEYLVNISK